MQKPLVALSVLAFAAGASAQGAAPAQSSVALFGVVDAALAHYSQGGRSRTMFDTSGNGPSSIGFRGTEQLGNGLSANFWMEAAILNGTGAGSSSGNGNPPTGGGLGFGRRSTLSLAGHFGEIRLGRDIPPSWWSHVVFDPFSSAGTGGGANITSSGGANGFAGANPLSFSRISNSVQYLWGFSPNAQSAIGRGVYAQLMYAFAGNASGKPALGQYVGGRLGYANGPVNVAVSYAQSKGTPYAADAAQGYSTYRNFYLGGSYNFGIANVIAHFGTNNSGVPGTKYTHWGLGAKIVAGPGYIPVAYNSVKQNNATSDGAYQISVGYVYNLSKRTAWYTTIAHIHNRNNGTHTFMGGNGGGNPGLHTAFGGGTSFGNGTGYAIGLRTSF